MTIFWYECPWSNVQYGPREKRSFRAIVTDTTFRIARESVEDRRGNSRCSANVFREKTRNIARRRELVASRRELPGNKVHALYMYTVLNNSTDRLTFSSTCFTHIKPVILSAPIIISFV